MTVPDLYTSSYRAINRRDCVAERLVPVRASIGSPRFIKGSGKWPKVAAIAPYGLFHIGEKAEFVPRYRARLDDFGVELIASKFKEIGDTYPGAALVLLCFEPCVEPDDWCHRQVFANWWYEQTAYDIHELEVQ